MTEMTENVVSAQAGSGGDPEHDDVGEVNPVFEEQPAEGPGLLVQTTEIPVGVPLTVPREGASPLQHQLAIGNAAARTASLKQLAEWLPGYDFEEAAQNVDSRRFMVIRLGDSLVRYLDGESMVERLLFAHDHTWGLGGISFSHGDLKGHQPPPDFAARVNPKSGLGRLDQGGLVRALDERWTAIINSADLYDPPLNEVCTHLTRAYGSPLNTNVYVSFGPSKGFGAHWDNHDTIIVPVHGSKRWALFEPAVLSAQRPWIGPDVSDRALWEGVLEPGMALVIPRGWGHRVDGSDDLSVHCTIGVARLEVHDLFERVRFEAGYWPVMRGDVPFDVREPAVSYGGSVFDEPDGFARTAGEIASVELIERAVASHRARIRRAAYPSFLDTFRAAALGDWSELTIKLVAPAGVMVHAELDDEVILAFNNRAVRVALEARDAVAALADCAPWMVGALPSVGGDEDRRPELARLLVTAGLATVQAV